MRKRATIQTDKGLFVEVEYDIVETSNRDIEEYGDQKIVNDYSQLSIGNITYSEAEFRPDQITHIDEFLRSYRYEVEDQLLAL